MKCIGTTGTRRLPGAQWRRNGGWTAYRRVVHAAIVFVGRFRRRFAPHLSEAARTRAG